jgi:ACS family pantothenate transporter-like MFS transporter
MEILCLTIFQIIGLWPCNLLLTRSNPKWFIPMLEVGWTLCTFIQAAMSKPIHMYVLRFILGLFETGHYSAIVYLCGAWYQKTELARRLAIINCATAIGPMFSSYLQAAAYTGLNGVHSMAGWQWLFIIDGVISIGVIIPQIFFFPDVPARQKPDLVFTKEASDSGKKHLF